MVGLHRIKTLECKCGTACNVCWRFVEWSCPSILWCYYLLLPWCYRHENWHMTSSPTHDVTVTSSMTSLFQKCGRWFSSLDRMCCTDDGESMVTPRMNYSFAPTHQHWARGWTSCKCCFWSLRCNLTWNQCSHF